ncbi:MAG: lycopene cyclase domain-containing protein [Ignavibacteriales bacterium]|nr:MAG: lycopene cyclase domain-containing protein [Ignavibacteriales bacterium]
MSTYLVINLLIVIVPLIFSFEKNIRFYKKIPSYLFSIIIVSTVFITWDSIASSRGDWGFNSFHISGIKYFSLPYEEILFFITVPYSCLFIFETISFYIKERTISTKPFLFLVGSLILIITAVIFYDQFYTSTVLLFSASFILISLLFFRSILKSRNYWLTVLITFIPFLIFNFVLTYIPVVVYSDHAIWGLKFITIPVEDFFYSYSMISFWILVYSIKEGRINFGVGFTKH